MRAITAAAPAISAARASATYSARWRPANSRRAPATARLRRPREEATSAAASPTRRPCSVTVTSGGRSAVASKDVERVHGRAHEQPVPQIAGVLVLELVRDQRHALLRLERGEQRQPDHEPAPAPHARDGPRRVPVGVLHDPAGGADAAGRGDALDQVVEGGRVRRVEHRALGRPGTRGRMSQPTVTPAAPSNHVTGFAGSSRSRRRRRRARSTSSTRIATAYASGRAPGIRAASPRRLARRPTNAPNRPPVDGRGAGGSRFHPQSHQSTQPTDGTRSAAQTWRFPFTAASVAAGPHPPAPRKSRGFHAGSVPPRPRRCALTPPATRKGRTPCSPFPRRPRAPPPFQPSRSRPSPFRPPASTPRPTTISTVPTTASTQGIMHDGGVCDPIRHMGC